MKIILTLFLLLIFQTTAYALPSAVILIRHAEKPYWGNTLSELGEKRALNLVNFVKNDKNITDLGPINFLFAASPKHDDSSIRSIQTITPLSKSLNIFINTNYTRGQEEEVAREILSNPIYNNKVIFIAWAHAKIAKLAHKLGSYNTPSEWEDEDYDHVWILKFNKTNQIDFLEINQYFP